MLIDDYSDSDDQFTDAQSAPMTPHLSSPLRRVTAAQDAESHDDDSQDAGHEDEAEVEVEDESKKSSDSTPETVIAESTAQDESQKDGPGQDTEAKEDVDEAGEVMDEKDNDDDFGDDFGDDFDDFAEGEEAHEDFDDFGNSFAQSTSQPTQPTGTSTPTASQRPPPFVSCLAH
jgi:hypothetical protein